MNARVMSRFMQGVLLVFLVNTYTDIVWAKDRVADIVLPEVLIEDFDEECTDAEEPQTESNSIAIEEEQKNSKLGTIEGSFSDSIYECGISISKEIFTPLQIRLNTEIYQEAKAIFSREHIESDYRNVSSSLYMSYLNKVDPLMPLAITVCETGMWADSRYTWTSGPIANSKALRRRKRLYRVPMRRGNHGFDVLGR